MNDKILCVDDDSNVLAACQRGLRRAFQVEIASSAAQALAVITADGPYAVIVSDLRMPGLGGVQFLARASALTPETVRILLTGAGDLQTAVEAINEGRIFRFLTKPCQSETLLKAVAAGVRQYHLVTAEKDLLRQTLRGSIKVLSDVLSLVNPTAFGRAARVQRLARGLAVELKCGQPWELDIAAMLSQIGCVAIPPDTMEKLYRGQPLGPEEAQMFAAHPGIGRSLVANIPRLEGVGEIIACQETRFDGADGPPDGRKGPDIPLGARILKAALDFDTLKSAGMADDEALRQLEVRRGWYDPHVLTALKVVARAGDLYEVADIELEELTGNMVLAADVRTVKGLLLACAGQETTPLVRQRLRNHALFAPLQKPIRVYVRRKSAAQPPPAPDDTPPAPAPPNRTGPARPVPSSATPDWRPAHEPHRASGR